MVEYAIFRREDWGVNWEDGSMTGPFFGVSLEKRDENKSLKESYTRNLHSGQSPKLLIDTLFDRNYQHSNLTFNGFSPEEETTVRQEITRRLTQK
ncbi:MAG: hypothetical protein AABX23_01020 [Nanoarchaeota archaeon]